MPIMPWDAFPGGRGGEGPKACMHRKDDKNYKIIKAWSLNWLP